MILKLKKELERGWCRCECQRANRHRLIAVSWRLIVVTGGAPPEAQAALGEGAVTAFKGVITKYESVKNYQKINEIWFFL